MALPSRNLPPTASRARVAPFLNPEFPITASGSNFPPQRHSAVPREPPHFSDDEPLPINSPTASTTTPRAQLQTVVLKALPEFAALGRSESSTSFTVLVGVRAPPLRDNPCSVTRAPIDLVTVLDVSGSMAGSKLCLLKSAMCFVIQNLGSSDRLSIVAFSSAARRVFPLRRMTDRGREDAVLAVNSLLSNGGTDIVEGLKKGVRVLKGRRYKNPVASIILLSDGKDTYNCDNQHPHLTNNTVASKSGSVLEYLNFLPPSICPINSESGTRFPVHTFGFGSDHDSTAMHAISDASAGTFSFIESVDIIQDAFARCIGGLLSVVAQELRLTVGSGAPGVHIGSIPSGKYSNKISAQRQRGVIDVGDLYADEEKEFLVYLSVPVSSACGGQEGMDKKTTLVDVQCSYKDPLSKETVETEGKIIEIERPEALSIDHISVCLEVDRQRNRLLVAEGISEAQRLADVGNLEGAQMVLAQRRSALLSSASARAGDGLCNWLEAELGEIRERMASLESYECSGRAYVLSGLSSHSWQRATTRGSSMSQPLVVTRETGTPSTSGAVGYDTPTMVSMVSMSQTLSSTPHVQPEHHSKSCHLAPRC